MAATAQSLTPLQLAELSLASLRNARRLFDDAVVLRSHGSAPGAFGSACLAAEELGKHMMVAPMFGIEEPTADDWRDFWKRWRQHTFKVGNMLWGQWVGDLQAEEIPAASDAHSLRLKLTYVDIAPDGTVMEPSDLADPGDIDEFLAALRGELEFYEQALGGIGAEALRDRLTEMRHSPEADDLRAFLDELGAPGAIAYGLAARNGASHDQALDAARYVVRNFEADEQPPT